MYTKTAVVCMPGPDYVTVVEYDPSTDPPVADFEANVTTIYVGQSIEFSDLSLNNPESWEWLFEEGEPATSGDQNPIITYNAEGTFDVSLTVTNPYGSDTKTEQDYINVLPLSIMNDHGTENTFYIQPNPVSNVLSVLVDGKNSGEFSASIFNAQGRLLKSKRLTEKETRFEMDHFESGLYLLRIGTTQNEKIIKFIKN
jgi:PKD repeat protein